MTNLATHLKDAILSQNRHLLLDLFEHPDYLSLTSEEMNTILETTSPLLQDSHLLQNIFLHPSIRGISPATVCNLTILTIRHGDPSLIDFCLYHPNFPKTGPLVEKIAKEALEYQGMKLIQKLSLFPAFELFFNNNFQPLAECAIRTNQREWIEELLQQEPSQAEANRIFPKMIRWAFHHKDKKIIALSLRLVHFDKEMEKTLMQALAEETAEEEEKEIDSYLLHLLIRHQDYMSLSPLILGWMLEQALREKTPPLINHLFQHPAYFLLSKEELAKLILSAMSIPEEAILKHLVHHPQFHAIFGADLGLILEEAARINHVKMIQSLLQHPHFELVTEDSFKRMAQAQIQTGDSNIQLFLKEPQFKKKYDQIIYEAIRRNESYLIDQFLRHPDLKKLVLQELIHYTTTDPLFVNKYIIRDVIREIFLTNEDQLIQEVASHPLFHKRIGELLTQAIQFDDEELIEKTLLNPILKDLFKNAWALASQEDKNRLYNLFISNPSFITKPPQLVQEIRSWKSPELA